MNKIFFGIAMLFAISAFVSFKLTKSQGGEMNLSILKMISTAKAEQPCDNCQPNKQPSDSPECTYTCASPTHSYNVSGEKVECEAQQKATCIPSACHPINSCADGYG